MPKITYLLGAGASAEALPLIKKGIPGNKLGLPEELKSFIEVNRSTILQFTKGWGTQNIKSLRVIAEKCNEFGTPDLYAKFLLETGDATNYVLLKALLSVYFKYKQELKNAFDYRALSFLTVITANQNIPSNIKIISWNYDSQIEKAAELLKPISPSGYSKVQGFTCWPNYENRSELSEEPFLFHINGVAGYNYCPRDFTKKIQTIFDFKSHLDGDTLLSFAWENEKNDKKRTFIDQRLTIARKIAEKTEILVVIGYSFPFFNRKIDEVLFKALKGSLRKIYFQDPYNNGNQLKEQFDLSEIVLSNIEHISRKDNYHIPFEL